MLTDSQRGASWLRREVQRELKYAEVEGPGSLWGSTPMTQNPVPRWGELSAFVIHTSALVNQVSALVIHISGFCNGDGPMTCATVR